MKIVYLDCFSGISGNMLLGALIDAGLPEAYLREQLAKLPIDGYQLLVERVNKCGISASYVDVKLHHHENDHAHSHSHHCHDHHHRHLADIVAIIDAAELADQIKQYSKAVFVRLAEAEAKVHGTTVEHIHFHEVGAVDAIVDIVGAAIGLSWFGIEGLYTSKLTVGSGLIECDHGVMPVPAPATAELLKHIPYDNGVIAKELVTPTGAAIVAALGNAYDGMPDGFISRSVGYGAGSWDLDIPNVLRLHVGELPVQAGSQVKTVIETNIDDLNPQNYEYVMDKLLAAGALDVWLTPIIMKKSRPAALLSVLANQQDVPCLTDIVFQETSTIGVRSYTVRRAAAERKIIAVETQWGQVPVKVAFHAGQVVNVSPEYEICRQLAGVHNVPLKKIQQAAVAKTWAVQDDQAAKGV